MGTRIIKKKKEWPHSGFSEYMEGHSPTASSEKFVMEAVPGQLRLGRAKRSEFCVLRSK